MDENEITNTMTAFNMSRDEAIEFLTWTLKLDDMALAVLDAEGEVLCKFFDTLEVK